MTKKQILLRLEASTVDQIDHISSIQGMTKQEWILNQILKELQKNPSRTIEVNKVKVDSTQQVTNILERLDLLERIVLSREKELQKKSSKSVELNLEQLEAIAKLLTLLA